nr:hemolymph lipopolysaccharide-binding protein-like [Nomia melanderi]
MNIRYPPTADVDVLEDVTNEIKHYICSQNDTASTCHCPEHDQNHDPCAGREPCSRQEESDSVLLQKLLLKNDLKLSKPELRDDYVYTPDIGLHKLHTRSVTWNAARIICKEEGGHLAIINSKAEARVLSEIFHKAGPVKGAPNNDEAFIGIHDYYSEGDWVTVLDESLAKTGFTKWSDKWGGQPDNAGTQNCGAFLAEGTLDDVSCDSTFPFFCEIPIENAV